MVFQAKKWQGYERLQVLCGPALVSDAPPKEPEDPNQLGAHGTYYQAVAPLSENPTSLSRATTARPYPRQEPSAVVPHARICAGGAGRPAFLPRFAPFNSEVITSNSKRKFYCSINYPNKSTLSFYLTFVFRVSLWCSFSEFAYGFSDPFAPQ